MRVESLGFCGLLHCCLGVDFRMFLAEVRVYGFKFWAWGLSGDFGWKVRWGGLGFRV